MRRTDHDKIATFTNKTPAAVRLGDPTVVPTRRESVDHRAVGNRSFRRLWRKRRRSGFRTHDRNAPGRGRIACPAGHSAAAYVGERALCSQLVTIAEVVLYRCQPNRLNRTRPAADICWDDGSF